MDFIQSVSGGMVMAIGGLFAYLGVLLWARQPHHRDRWLIVTAATGTGAIVFLLNGIARALGWWDWWGYTLPLVVQAGLLWLLPAILFTFILIGYRWLVARSRRPLLWYGLTLIIVLVPLTVIGDLYNIERGKLSLGGGYTIWQDVLMDFVYHRVKLHANYKPPICSSRLDCM